MAESVLKQIFEQPWGTRQYSHCSSQIHNWQASAMPNPSLKARQQLRGPNAWPQTTFCHQTLSQSKPPESGRPASQPSNMDTPSQMLSYSSNRQLFSNRNLTLNTSFPNTRCTLPCNVVQSKRAQSASSAHTAQCNTATTRGKMLPPPHPHQHVDTRGT